MKIVVAQIVFRMKGRVSLLNLSCLSYLFFFKSVVHTWTDIILDTLS